MITSSIASRTGRNTLGSHGKRKSEKGVPAVLAGAYADPADGAALVFRADDDFPSR